MAIVEVERGPVTVVTLNDPDRRNAMTVEMGESLAEALRQLADDPGLRAVVLTGAPPAFSGGGDLAMLEEHARRTREENFDATEEMRTFYERFLALRDLPVPVVAAVNGHAIGAGLCVALGCDLRIVAEEAKVGLNFAKLALHPGMGASWLLPRIVGEQRAAELLYTGRLVSGSEMGEYGLALDVLPSAQVLNRARQYAEDIAGSSPTVVRQLKVSLDAARTNSLSEQLALEAAHQAVNYGTEDLVEGLAAGRERRSPQFNAS